MSHPTAKEQGIALLRALIGDIEAQEVRDLIPTLSTNYGISAVHWFYEELTQRWQIRIDFSGPAPNVAALLNVRTPRVSKGQS